MIYNLSKSKLFLLLVIFKFKACSVACKLTKQFAFTGKFVICRAGCTFVNNSVHRTAYGSVKWMCVLFYKLCSNLIIALADGDCIISNMSYFCPQIGGNSIFLPINQNHTDNSGKMESQ